MKISKGVDMRVETIYHAVGELVSWVALEQTGDLDEDEWWELCLLEEDWYIAIRGIEYDMIKNWTLIC